MEITTMPASRFGCEGQTVEYVVRAQGATELAVPAKSTDGLNVRILETRQVDGGVESRVAVDVTKPVFY